MNLVLAARGHLDHLNRWENNIMAKFLTFNPDETIKKNMPLKPGQVYVLQAALRPIRFYEIAFPEPKLNDVLQLIRPGKCWQPHLNTPINLLRRFMKLKKVPDNPPPDDRVNHLFMPHDGIECVGIGIKKDRIEKGVELV